MRLLLIDANHFSYFPSYASKKVAIHFREGAKKQEDYDNCLVVHVAVEPRDNNNTIESAKSGIKELAAEFDVKNIVLLPNVHLTESPAKSRKDLKVLKQLWERLDRLPTWSTHLEAFGYSGEWKISSKSHLRSVLGRRYK